MNTKLVLSLLVVLTVHTLHASPLPSLATLNFQELQQLMTAEIELLANQENDNLQAQNEALCENWHVQSEAEEDLEDPDLFEGDIVLTGDDLVELQNWEASEQDALREKKYRWPGGIVSYEFHDSVTKKLKENILKAIEEYESRTCLRFREAVSGDRILFTKEGSGCSSFVGRRGGTQKVTLAHCSAIRIALHEIGHAIGFWHEQSRPDRDRYVTINWDNINEDNRHNFLLRKKVDYQNEAYDYGSIMHYGYKFFSIDRDLGSITVNNSKVYEQQGRPVLGGAHHLSPIDVRQINKMYKCFNSHGQEGTLIVTMLRGGTFASARPKRACVRAYNSAEDSIRNCTDYTTEDHTNPVWDQALTFEPRGDSGWRYFEITVQLKNKQDRPRLLLGVQTIWVDGIHQESEYCTNPKLCMEWEYRVEGGGAYLQPDCQ